MISLQRYRDLFRVPGLAATLLSSVPGRLPIGIAGLAILLFMQGKSGSFAQAGTVSALYVLGLGAVAPFVGRLVDRLGPRPILAVCSTVYPAALTMLVALVWREAHPLWVAACAFAAGAMLPPITICVRTLFPRVVTDVGLLRTAYSIDSALVETVFILGPALVAGFVAIGYPGGAVLLAAVCAAAGGVVFLRAPAVRNWTVQATHARHGSVGPLRQPGLLAVFAATTLYSVAFGLFEVGVTAYAAKKGAPAAAGIALALASVGSAAGALVYGARHWSPSLTKQFLIALGLMAGGALLLAPIDNLYVFALASVIAGAPMAPVIATQSTLVSSLAPREMLAESFTWGSSCLLGGISAGIAAGGVLAERVAPPWILVAAATATGAAALVAWLTLADEMTQEKW